MLHSAFRLPSSKLTSLCASFMSRPFMNSFPPTIPSVLHFRFNPRPLMKRCYTSMDSRKPWRVQLPSNRRYNRPNPLFEGNNSLYAIIGINCGVFGMWQFAQDRQSLKFMYQNFTISPFGFFREWRFHTAITSYFSHRDGISFLVVSIVYMNTLTYSYTFSCTYKHQLTHHLFHHLF